MFRAIIFDLDSCLSAADEVGRELYEPAFRAIREANRGTLANTELDRAFADMWRIPFDVVSKEHGFSKEMCEAGWKAFAGLEVTKPMHGYGDLHVIPELNARKFLVTSGFRRLQESKIRALGFADQFEGIQIDAIDEPDPKGKERIFAEILETHNLPPAEVLVVGDNPASEIAAGRRLGMKTAQVLRNGVPKGDNAHFYVQGLAELKTILGG